MNLGPCKKPSGVVKIPPQAEKQMFIPQPFRLTRNKIWLTVYVTFECNKQIVTGIVNSLFAYEKFQYGLFWFCFDRHQFIQFTDTIRQIVTYIFQTLNEFYEFCIVIVKSTYWKNLRDQRPLFENKMINSLSYKVFPVFEYQSPNCDEGDPLWPIRMKYLIFGFLQEGFPAKKYNQIPHGLCHHRCL